MAPERPDHVDPFAHEGKMNPDPLSSLRLRTHPAMRSALVLLSLAGAACSDDIPLPTAADPGGSMAADPVPGLANETVPNSWTTRAQMPTARFGLVAAKANGIIYAIGGWAGAALGKVEAYNPSTSTLVAWKPRASLPTARFLPNGAAVINGKIYVPGGLNAQGQATSTLFVYDVAGNAWFAKAHMPLPSYGGAAAAIDGKLYVLATPPGQDGDFTTTRLFRYDPATNTWSERAPAPHHHHQSVARAINGKLYVAGGLTFYSDGATHRRAWAELDVYHPATNTWTTEASMPTARYGAVGGVMDGKLYVAGGWAGVTPVSTLEVYDPVANTWAARTDMPTARGGAGAGVVNGVLYVLGGRTVEGKSTLRTNEAYTK
jgi:N-acetylneuraminic acid mutarotase